MVVVLDGQTLGAWKDLRIRPHSGPAHAMPDMVSMHGDVIASHQCTPSAEVSLSSCEDENRGLLYSIIELSV